MDIRAGMEFNVLKAISVKNVMNPQVETIPERLNLRELAKKISKTKYNSFPVVNDLAYRDVITISVDDNIFSALEKSP